MSVSKPSSSMATLALNTLCLHLHLFKCPFFVKQLSTNEPIPVDFLQSVTDGSGEPHKLQTRFFSVTRTDEEISVVSEAEEDDGDATWRCIKVAGPMDFGSSLRHGSVRRRCETI